MSDHGVERRDFLRKAGTVAWATPLILTLSASGAGAQALSCYPKDYSCGTWDAVEGNCTIVFCCVDCEPVEEVHGSPCYCT